MKCFARFGLLAGWILLLMSCTKNPQAPSVANDSQALLKSSSPLASPTKLKAGFDQLAVMLAQRAPNVIGKIIGTSEGEMPFSDLKLDSDLPRQFVMNDGRTLETTLERAQPCKVTPRSTASTIIFAPDPDRFQRDDESHICKGWDV